MEVYLTKEAAEHQAAVVAEWKAKQPDYIAVKMTNAEIMTLFNVVSYTTYFAVWKPAFSKLDYQLIAGELYKKTLNPKDYSQRNKPVIPWEDAQ